MPMVPVSLPDSVTQGSDSVALCKEKAEASTPSKASPSSGFLGVPSPYHPLLDGSSRTCKAVADDGRTLGPEQKMGNILRQGLF
jgi:hypothetical protein